MEGRYWWRGGGSEVVGVREGGECEVVGVKEGRGMERGKREGGSEERHIHLQVHIGLKVVRFRRK